MTVLHLIWLSVSHTNNCWLYKLRDSVNLPVCKASAELWKAFPTANHWLALFVHLFVLLYIWSSATFWVCISYFRMKSAVKTATLACNEVKLFWVWCTTQMSHSGIGTTQLKPLVGGSGKLIRVSIHLQHLFYHSCCTHKAIRIVDHPCHASHEPYCYLESNTRASMLPPPDFITASSLRRLKNSLHCCFANTRQHSPGLTEPFLTAAIVRQHLHLSSLRSWDAFSLLAAYILFDFAAYILFFCMSLFTLGIAKSSCLVHVCCCVFLLYILSLSCISALYHHVYCTPALCM